jgi:DNA uptake protein ComE-like DNA-binding protein
LKREILLFILVICVLIFFKLSYNVEKQPDISFKKKLNLYEASKSDLIKIKGIGEKKANKIIELREKKLLNEKELKKILGNVLFSNISSQITVKEKH